MIDTQRVLGEHLKDAPKNTGAKGVPNPGPSKNRGSARAPRIGAPPTLAEIGLTKRESSEAA